MNRDKNNRLSHVPLLLPECYRTFITDFHSHLHWQTKLYFRGHTFFTVSICFFLTGTINVTVLEQVPLKY